MFSSSKEKLESIIGENSQFKGDIVTKGTLRVDGRITGNIESDVLVLGDKAFVKGMVSAISVVVGGMVEGNINAKDIVEIKNKGQVKGDIYSSKLVVNEGGIIDGKINMHPSDAVKVIELQKQ